jgi:pyruvate,orthophosphate dikinase
VRKRCCASIRWRSTSCSTRRLIRKAPRDVLTKGLPASPGAASGKIVFDADTAEKWNDRGEAVILVRVETSPEDIHGMHAARGILTARGGMTSHAAVVARGMGRPCVSGAGSLANRQQREGAARCRP